MNTGNNDRDNEVPINDNSRDNQDSVSTTSSSSGFREFLRKFGASLTWKQAIMLAGMIDDLIINEQYQSAATNAQASDNNKNTFVSHASIRINTNKMNTGCIQH